MAGVAMRAQTSRGSGVRARGPGHPRSRSGGKPRTTPVTIANRRSRDASRVAQCCSGTMGSAWTARPARSRDSRRATTALTARNSLRAGETEGARRQGVPAKNIEERISAWSESKRRRSTKRREAFLRRASDGENARTGDSKCCRSLEIEGAHTDATHRTAGRESAP